MIINGWTIFAHSLFLEQLEDLLRKVEHLRRKDPKGHIKKNATRKLAAIAELAFDTLPRDPTRTDYRQGSTVGDEHKYWFRAKFFRQYQLFFRYHQESKIIVYAWVNDDDTRRASGSNTDAYRVFRRMIKSGHPPDDWKSLLEEARQESRLLKHALKKSGKASR